VAEVSIAERKLPQDMATDRGTLRLRSGRRVRIAPGRDRPLTRRAGLGMGEVRAPNAHTWMCGPVRSEARAKRRGTNGPADEE
jgi:hypothetical protein